MSWEDQIDWTDIRGFTLKRPWPVTIFYGPKRIENRTQKPPEKFVGKFVLFHAGSGWDAEREPLIRKIWPAFDSHRDRFRENDIGIVGVVRILGALEVSMKDLFDHGNSRMIAYPIRFNRQKFWPSAVTDVCSRFNDDNAQEPWILPPVGGGKRFAWILDEIHALEKPVPCKGMLGFWPVSEEVIKECRGRKWAT